MIKVVALTGTLTHAREDRKTCVLLCDVIDEFHHVDRLAHSGATKEAHLAALRKWAD